MEFKGRRTHLDLKWQATANRQHASLTGFAGLGMAWHLLPHEDLTGVCGLVASSHSGFDMSMAKS